MSDIEDDPEAKAARLGLDMVVPQANELLLDLDTLAAVEVARRGIVTLKENNIPVSGIVESTSQGGNTHVRLTLGRSLTDVERIALQAMLGSDPVREILSLLRVWQGTARPPTVFFEVPGAHYRAISLEELS